MSNKYEVSPFAGLKLRVLYGFSNQAAGANALGSGYAFGPVTMNLIATDTHLDYRGAHHLRVDNYEINRRYQVTPALTAGLGYIFTNGDRFTSFTRSGATLFATGNHRSGIR